MTFRPARPAASEDVDGLVARLDQSLLASLPDRLPALERGLRASRIGIDTHPPDLLRRVVGRAGEIRIEIHPREDLLDPAALERFVKAVRAVGPQAVAPAPTIYQSARVVVRALQQAFASALIVIAMLLLLLWRDVFQALPVLIPLLLAGLHTPGIPSNFADAIVLPLLLGIGIDSAITSCPAPGWETRRKGSFWTPARPAPWSSVPRRESPASAAPGLRRRVRRAAGADRAARRQARTHSPRTKAATARSKPSGLSVITE